MFSWVGQMHSAELRFRQVPRNGSPQINGVPGTYSGKSHEAKEQVVTPFLKRWLAADCFWKSVQLRFRLPVITPHALSQAYELSAITCVWAQRQPCGHDSRGLGGRRTLIHLRHCLSVLWKSKSRRV